MNSLHFRRRRRARRRAQAREGMVLLVVILVLSMATALASTSLKLGRSALHEAGIYRKAVQSRYLVEAALEQGIVWSENGANSGWSDSANLAPPGSVRMFNRFGQRDRDPLRHEMRIMSRTNMEANLNAQERPIFELPTAANNMVGTLGTTVTYTPDNTATAGRTDMMVLFMDCRPYGAGSSGVSTGNPGGSGGGGGATEEANLCQVEAHASLEALGGGTRTWAVPGQTGVYTQVMAGVQRTAVASVVIQLRP